MWWRFRVVEGPCLAARFSSARPGVGNPRGLLPLSPELIVGYGADAVERSHRRAQVSEWLDSTKGQMLTVRDKLIIT